VFCVEVTERFPDKASQFLRNIQNCFKELPRVPGTEYRSGMAYAATVVSEKFFGPRQK